MTRRILVTIIGPNLLTRVDPLSVMSVVIEFDGILRIGVRPQSPITVITKSGDTATKAGDRRKTTLIGQYKSKI